MPLIDSEASIYGSRPLELYEFVADGQSYFLTPHRVPYVFGGDTYQPSAQLSRQNIVRAAAGDKPPELVIDVAEAEDVIQENCYESVPLVFTVRVHRIQPGGSHTWWDGVIAGGTSKGTRHELRCPSQLADLLKNDIPTITFTEQCQHFLFDAHCQVDPLDWAQAATVSGVGTPDDVTVVVSTIDGHPDQYYRGGVILSLSGEYRLIVDQVGTTLKLFHPFRSIAAAQAVTLYASCDRTIATCVDRFNNLDNFGGYPLVPLRNRFRN